MLQEVEGFPGCSDKPNLAIHELTVGPTEVSSTKHENTLRDGTVFKVMVVHLENCVFQSLLGNHLHLTNEVIQKKTHFPQKVWKRCEFFCSRRPWTRV